MNLVWYVWSLCRGLIIWERAETFQLWRSPPWLDWRWLQDYVLGWCSEIFPTPLIFPCWEWPSCSCASSRCALQGSPGVSRSGRKPGEVSGSGNLGWKPWKWACVREILPGAELLNNFFPMSWVWKSMRQHNVPEVQRKGKKRISRRQTDNPTPLLFTFTQFGTVH